MRIIILVLLIIGTVFQTIDFYMHKKGKEKNIIKILGTIFSCSAMMLLICEICKSA